MLRITLSYQKYFQLSKTFKINLSKLLKLLSQTSLNMFSSKTLALVSLLAPFALAQNYGAAPASTPTPAAAAAAAASSSAVSASSGSAKTQTISAAVASFTDLTFTPNFVVAAPGSVVEFHFGANNHSIAESSFAEPCSPLNSSSIFAGFNFVTTAGVEAPSVFQIQINDTTPIWFYCPQVSPIPHCPAGMAGVINPPKGKTAAQFVTAAMALNTTVIPSTIQGGVIVKSNAAASSSSGSSPSTSTTASPSTSPTKSGASQLVGMGFMGLVGIAFSALLSF